MGETRPSAGQQWPADEPMQVPVDQWLEPFSVTDAVATLTSGELTAATRVEYDPVGPRLLVYPDVALRPRLGYVLTIDGTALSALGGGPGDEVRTVGFTAGPPSGWQRPPVPGDAEMATLFAERCGCHGPSGDVFPTLTRDGVLGVASARRPERLLAQPGRPMQSQLVLRVLADYPGVRGMQKALTDAERRAIVRWVRHL